jgi:NADH-quinone oxidoreductase subunit A
VRFHLVAIAFLVFDVELLFLYPWAVVFQSKPAATSGEQLAQPSQVGSAPSTEAAAAADLGGDVAGRVPEGRPPWIFAGGMIFVGLLVLGFIYDWRKGIFEWR